jgi:predicted SprT family Zn-dependent metalloprotease
MNSEKQKSGRRASFVSKSSKQAAPVLQHSINHWAKLWRVTGLGKTVELSFSKRLTKSLGTARRKSGVIRLHSGLLAGRRALLLEALCHEVAHIAAYKLHGLKAKPHGPEWRALVEAAGYKATIALRHPSIVPARKLKATYRYSCPVCHTAYFSRRKSSRLRCGHCLDAGLPGSLELATKK